MNTDPERCDICAQRISGAWSQTICSKSDNVLESRCIPCDRAKRWAKYRETRILTMALLLDAARGDCATDVIAARDFLQHEVKAFEAAVWFGGLQELVEKHSGRGMRADAEGLTLLTYVLAGRVAIQVELGEAHVQLIAAEGESTPRTGLNGIFATEGQAIYMLRKATRLWEQGMRPRRGTTK